MSDDLLEYGAKANADEIKKTLDHIFVRNDSIAEKGGRGTPVCIWGTHGIGKTQIVQDFAHQRKWRFVYCAPAQFEEMGDLHGMPAIADPDPNSSGDEYTVYRPPEWVPTEEGPGILLLDDINRADDRILRGCMQLLQNFELSSWKLPAKWQIVATANPEGGDYSVTPMDDAMLTRMLHTTLKFDARIWAEWATGAGVDPRGIAFVLTYPEVVTGKRTTPRSLTQFFDQIGGIEDLKAEIELVNALALSALDDITVSTFISFVNDDLTELLDPEEVLDAKKFADVEKRIKTLAKGRDGGIRVDRLATICTRLFILLTREGYEPAKSHTENLVLFMLSKVIPNDLQTSLYMDLTKHGSDKVKEMMRDKRLASKLLKGM
jgi:MoxR-like ATPase